jgi:hypothetical protein
MCFGRSKYRSGNTEGEAAASPFIFEKEFPPMKTSTVLVFAILFASQIVAAQETARSGMPTIETDAFTRLEKRGMDAIVAQDRATLEAMLTPDFELRTARTGGEITLRDEWLQAATSTYKIRSFAINGLTVRMFGTYAIVNFLYEQQANFSGRDLSGDFFIVDLWQKTGGEWKLAARYSAGPGLAPQERSNPKVKR